jgi:hypothetical protein
MLDEFKGEPALDAGLVSAAQAVEHYEIAPTVAVVVHHQSNWNCFCKAHSWSVIYQQFPGRVRLRMDWELLSGHYFGGRLGFLIDFVDN